MPTQSRMFALTLASVLMAGGAGAAPVGHTQNGKVTGLSAQGIKEFLGIRYAAPPVGALRWQPPQPVPEAMATTQATAFGNICPQSASSFGVDATTEDCLFLNVFAPGGKPAAGAAKWPVMVWIHGGALLTGASNFYNPVRLVKQGNVIVVTLNYRLGYLGYFAEPGLDSEGHVAGNYGLMDQQFALDWVQRNIAGFGGDPSNVTVFGESAGGLSVLSNLASPTAHGLFQKAIVESGAYSLNLPSLALEEFTGATVAQNLGCAAADTVCLRAASVSDILTQQNAGGTSLTTMVDGTTLPNSLDVALKTGAFNRVPVMNGSNHDEYRLFLTGEAGLLASQYLGVLQFLFGDTEGKSVSGQYPVASFSQPVLALGAVITDEIFACPARLVDAWASRYVPVYGYEFNDENAPEDFLPNVGYPYGAAHASELQYLFDVPDISGAPALTTPQKQLARTMVRYWTQFATSATPNAAASPVWAAYNFKADVLQSLVPPSPIPESDFATSHHCIFWKPLLPPG